MKDKSKSGDKLAKTSDLTVTSKDEIMGKTDRDGKSKWSKKKFNKKRPSRARINDPS